MSVAWLLEPLLHLGKGGESREQRTGGTEEGRALLTKQNTWIHAYLRCCFTELARRWNMSPYGLSQPPDMEGGGGCLQTSISPYVSLYLPAVGLSNCCSVSRFGVAPSHMVYKEQAT